MLLIMSLPSEYLYSIAAFFSFSAYLLKDILWLRILLVFAAIVYIITGISLGITSMIGWNSAYLVINLFHVIMLLLDKSTINLPDETKYVYHQVFEGMSTREFKKLITINKFEIAIDEQLFQEGKKTSKLMMLLEGKVDVVKSDKYVTSLYSGDLVGEMSFMSKDLASASVYAVDNVLYAYWSHQDLARLKIKNNDIYNKFINVIGQDLVKKLNNKNL